MYDELVKSLRQCAEASCAGCKNELVQIGCRGLLQHEAADAIEELSSAGSIYGKAWTLGYDAGRDENMPRWIPVTERLPEVDKNVLVFACGNEITIGRMKRQTENGYHVFIICHGIARELARPGRITHWMPLPSTPTEE